MEPKKTQLEQQSVEPVVIETTEVSDSGLALDEGVSGRVSEMVGENASEATTGQSGSTQQDDSQAQTQVSAKESLREELLKSAPKPEAMRREVLSKLEAKRNRLEQQLNRERKKANYYKMTLVIRDLRAVLVLIERVAHAGLEALKDFWLKVVHKFA